MSRDAGALSWVLVVLVIAAPCQAGDGGNALKIGEPAPAIDVAKLLQAPDGARIDLRSLRGKVVVLEFWATWCSACIPQFPILDKLRAQYKDKPVVFVSITDEDEETVRKFLRKTPINGWIALDRDGATFGAYRISGRPTTAIIDGKGRFAGFAIPLVLLEEPRILRDALAGRPSTLLSEYTEAKTRERPDPFADLDSELGAAPPESVLCQIVIRRAGTKDRSASGWGGRGSWRYDRTLLDHIVSAYGYHTRRSRIILETSLPKDQKYDVIVRSGKMKNPAMKRAIQKAIEGTFDLTITPETREMDAYVLSIAKGETPTLVPFPGYAYFDKESGLTAPTKALLERLKAGERFFRSAMPIRVLAYSLGGVLGRPVVIDDPESMPDGSYNYYFPFDEDKESPEKLIAELRKRFGLVLTPARRKVDLLVVASASNDD